MPKPGVLAIFALLFAPSAWFTWENRDMPNFGYYHDDGIYFTAAQSLAQTGEYRIPSYPGTPYQTKYPPGLPALHALAWWIEPGFPANLGVAIWLQWIWLPVFAWLAWLLLAQWGFTEPRRWVVIAVLAFSPYPLFFSTSILSEIPFGALLALCFLLLGRGRIWLAALVAGLAFLTRTAGIVLLVSVPIVLLLEKKRREALQFFLGMMPFAVWWFVWSRMHQTAASGNDLTLYYTNYLGYHFHVFTLADAHLFLWKNGDKILQSAGAFLLPTVYEGQLPKIAAQVLGVAGFAGAIRLFRGVAAARQYAVFTAISVAILLLWSFPPNERFLLPLAPMFLAGFVMEASRIVAAMRKTFSHKDRSQRIAGYFISACVALLMAFCAYTQWLVRFEMMPMAMQQERDRRAELLPMYEWISRNTPPSATFLAGYDSSLYLYTGRRGSHEIISPAHWYRDENLTAYQNAVEHAGEHGFDFLLWTPYDRRNDVDLQDQLATGRKLLESRKVRLLHENKNVFLYAFIAGSR